LGFNLGCIGGFLVIKLVKPIKTFRSWSPRQGGLNQILSPQAKTNVGTGTAWVLWETNTSVWQKLCRLDALHGIGNQTRKFSPSFLCDPGFQILDFDESLANEDDFSNFGNACDPGITNQLWIKS